MSARPFGRDDERVASIRAALEASSLDGLICALPSNVLLASGYWPVIGTACAVVGPHATVVVAPRDEYDFARAGWADAIVAFDAGSLENLDPVAHDIREPLRSAIARAGIEGARVGVESGPQHEPSTYVGAFRFGDVLGDLLRQEGLTPVPADDVLSHLRSRVTAREHDAIAGACAIAQRGFAAGSSALRPGVTESEAAERFRAPLGITAEASGVRRAGGYVFAMSGENGANAFGAYARSTSRRMRDGELVLVHCNSYADGYWTDITRTYCLGEPGERQRALYDAVLSARDAAIASIRPGVRAAAVDAAARDVIASRGFGAQFKHSTGHGVGFVAIDARAHPRLHPASTDVLRAGMVCNVEPAIYVDGYCGLRHCDMIAVTEAGAEVLTPFHERLEDLVLHFGSA